MMSESKSIFRFLYGFIILIVLIVSVFLVKITADIAANLGEAETNRIHATQEEIVRGDIRGKGLPAPTGRFSLGQIIEAYELDKDEFYNALGLPPDFPETEIVKKIIDKKMTSSKQVKDYMQPIIDEFQLKHKENKSGDAS